MSYLLRSSARPNRRKILPLLVLLVLVAFAALLHFLRPYLAGGIFSYVAYPFWKVEDYATDSIALGLRFIEGKRALLEENDHLRTKAKTTEMLLMSLEQYRKENEELKSLLGRENRTRTILAAILAGPPVSAYDTLVVDAGEKDGVAVRSTVLIDGIAVGFIEAVYGRTSLVKLFSAPGEKVSVTIGESHVRAEAEGRGGGNFAAKLPKDVQVAVGETVRIPGTFSNLLGIVGLIEGAPTDPFQTVVMRTPINFFESSWVEIVVE